MMSLKKPQCPVLVFSPRMSNLLAAIGLFAIFLSMTGCSCSRNSSNDNSNVNKAAIDQNQVLVQAWSKLISGQSVGTNGQVVTDLTMARAFAPVVFSMAPEAAQKMMTDLDSLDLSNPETLRRQLSELKDRMTDMQKSLQTKYFISTPEVTALSTNLLKNSVLANPRFADQASANVDLLVRSYLHQRVYQSLVKTMAAKASSNSKTITGSVMAKLKRTDPNLYYQIQNLPHSTEVDLTAQVTSILNQSQEYQSDIYALSQAGGLFNTTAAPQVEEDFRSDLESQVVENIVQGIQSNPTYVEIEQGLDILGDKAKEFSTYAHSLKTEIQAIKVAVNGSDNNGNGGLIGSLNKFQSEVNDDVNSLSQEVKSSDSLEDKIASSTGILVGGAKESLGTLAEIGQNAGNTLDRVGDFCATVEHVATTLGVKIDPQVADAVNKAKQAGQVLKLGGAVMEAISTGGVSAVFDVMGGAGALPGALGGGGGADLSGVETELAGIQSTLNQMQSQLTDIRRTEDQILDGEKQIMEQIKNLSQQMADYHNQEMNGIYAIEDSVAKLGDVLSQNAIKPCSTISSELQGHGSNSSTDSSFIITNGSTFHSAVQSADELSGFLSNILSNRAQDCLKDLQDNILPVAAAFTGSLIDNSANSTIYILSDRKSSDSVALKNSEVLFSNGYFPLVEYLTFPNEDILKGALRGLNFPLTNFDAVEEKAAFLQLIERNSSLKRSSFQSLVTLKSLYSSLSIDQVVSQYMMLRPFLHFDSAHWSPNESTVSPKQLANYFSDNAVLQEQVAAAHTLDSALTIIQVGIAQEAILRDFVFHWEEILSGSGDGDLKISLIDAVRGNPILLGNLVSYQIYLIYSQATEGQKIALDQAITAGKVSDLAAILPDNMSLFSQNLDLTAFKNKLAKGDKAIVLNVPAPTNGWSGSGFSILLPSPSRATSKSGSVPQWNHVMYRNSLSRLLNLQNQVLSDLLGLSVGTLDPRLSAQLAAITMYQAGNNPIK